MQTLRKAIAIFTIFVTVLSLSVAVAPKANAAASAGDLIKMNGLSSIYYLGADGKRYVFPNESTYFSWYSDFSQVVTIPQAELESYPLGKNVTVRPGTKLVKITTNPNVYAVTPGGVLVRVPDESTAATLYGANWAKRVIDVADSFFTNYTIGTSVLTATAYPAGSLIKSATEPTVYYINADGTASKVATETAFNANRFSFSNVITTSVALPTLGADITAAVATITDTASGAGGVIPTGGSGLTVSLSGDTAAAASVPSLSTMVPWASVNMTASNDGAVTVNDVTFTRTGTGAASDFSGGYLYVGSTRLTTLRTVSTSDNKITFSTIGLTIPAGTTKTVTLKMNANTSSNVSGNHAFKIAAASDIVTGGATVSGSFPVQGNVLSYSAVNAATVVVTGTDGTGSKKVGETKTVLSEFTIANSNSLEDVNVTRVRLKNNGTAANDAAANYSLELDGVKVAEGVSMVDKYVDFQLATPYLLKQAKTITATVRADIVTDVTKTIELYLNNVADFEATGTAYGNFYSPKVTNTFGTGNATAYTIAGSAITVSYDGPAAADVKQNTKNYVFANLMIKSANDDVTIDTLPFTLVTSAASTTATLDNVKLVDSGNGVSYGVASDPAGLATSETLTFENVVLKKGVQYKFAVTGDVPNNVGTFTYRVDWAASGVVATYVGSDVAVSASDFSASTLTGKTFTVAAAKLTFTTAPVNAATYVKSAQKVLLYKFTAAANSVDNLKLSKLKVATTTGSSGLATLDQAFDKIELYRVDSAGAETLLDDETSLSGSSVTFSGFTTDIAKGSNNTATFVVRGNVKSAPTAGTVKLLGSTTKSDYTVRDSDSASLLDANIVVTAFTASHASTIATEGTYTAIFDNTEVGTNSNQNVLAGTSKALVGRIKFTAAKENALVKKISVTETGTITGADVSTLSLYKDKAGTQLVGTAAYVLDTNGYFDFDLTGAPFEVKNVGATYLYVFANVNGIDYSASPAPASTATAGRTIYLSLADTGDHATEATGKDTGTTLSDSGVNGAASMYSTVMGAVVSNITTAFADATLSSGTKDVFSFKVTAPASGNTASDGTPLGANIGTTTLTVASSSGITLSTFKVRRVGGANGEQTAGANATLVNGSLQIDFQAIYEGLTDGVVKPGETAEYVITATVGGISGTGNSLSVTLETVDTNFNYYHTTTTGAVTAEVNPLISGLTSVRGGTLKQ